MMFVKATCKELCLIKTTLTKLYFKLMLLDFIHMSWISVGKPSLFTLLDHIVVL